MILQAISTQKSIEWFHKLLSLTQIAEIKITITIHSQNIKTPPVEMIFTELTIVKQRQATLKNIQLPSVEMIFTE